VVPGRYTALWFEATKTGTFQVFCTEFCGDQHSAMLSKLHVLPQAEFESWLAEDPYKGLSMAQIGETLFANRCSTCHLPTAAAKIGPGLLGVFGKERVFANAPSLVADEGYLRESILKPQAKLVKGFEDKVMTSFQGQLNEDELMGVIEYLKSLK
jgi:cytochrome c oxidase subunit 2